MLERIGQALPVVLGAATLGVLGAKLLLAWRLNVNWDEFFYLSQVHALARGELELLLQGAYTHLFRWVTTLQLQEVDQVVCLRVLMWALLVLSAGLLYRLARRFASPAGASFALLAFIASWPVLKHGASFRADSMLLPLTLAVLLLATRTSDRPLRNDLGAGLCLAAAFALTSKAVLLLPALVVMVFASGVGTPLDAARAGGAGRAVRRITWILVTAVPVSALLIAAHSTQVVASAEPVGAFAVRTVTDALLDVPLLPRGEYFRNLVWQDLVFWAALLAGLAIAARLRAYVAAASALTLLPILYYRNAFPYYYPVMMAPAAILVALSADWLRQRRAGLLALAALGLLLIHHAWDGVMTLRFDEQQKQREVIAAVRRIFPANVPYIDHSGMIASFPKVNFLMSSWGVEDYLRRGRDFMPDLLSTSRPPPLLLANHGVLVPGTLLYRRLSAMDRKLLESTYVDYWGPIKVAGVEFAVPADGTVTARVPFAGRYRLASGKSIQLNGVRLDPGETIEIPHAQESQVAATGMSGSAETARLVWADARPAPEGPPPASPLYSGL